ncbi:RNA polymerase sporulation sigma factor SigK [Clostridium aminobutyricum]|uniref:RNA polymerase sigma factor n=1 Tax=Clostridium aminobutyricum TaxID=33953 RepID=A0A939D7Y4_CLOAM|nr:RNA polymerase sporulation sigma factor SigK [Clostridium aminobutyricum]MBN7772776.1 RNA polymerase sporulation sigma factor SigK [Clostridium aminobutyricum]
MGNSFPKPLTSKEEEYYLKQFEEGDPEAKNILIVRNLRLVAHIVKKYAGNTANSDDLISIGTIGLIKAINTYSSKRSTRLATYAAKCIENEILMNIRSEKKRKLEISLNEPIGTDKDGNEINFNDILGSDPDAILDDIHYKMQVNALYCAIYKILTRREQAVIIKRYGITGEDPKTQRELAKELGISRSYVSRIEKKAVEKLRDYINI